ncbi:MAG: hypothetical protein GX163_05010 [Bacteroidetes bacterium]|jgi:hypothetical protein|nr:hypothetical protein [Bacteroidota bacterium]
MKAFLKYIGFLSITFLILASLMSFISLYSLRTSSLYKPSFIVNSVSENNFDYIILGSSVGLTTLNTKLIDSITRMNGINFSEDDTGLSSQYLMLQHTLYEGKKMKYCILAPGLAALRNKDANIGGNDYRFVMHVNRDYIGNYYKEAAPNSFEARILYTTKYLPFVGVSYYNTELFFPSIRVLFDKKKRNRFDDKGNYTYPQKKANLKEKPLDTVKVTFDHTYLKKIEALCKKNDIELIYYFSPEYQKFVSYEKPENLHVINHSNIFQDELSLFYDPLHVNSKGREKATLHFIKDFEQFYLSDSGN